MQELIDLIVSGDVNFNQILQRLTLIHNANCDETDMAIDRIEQLEGEATVNQLATLELKAKLTKAENLYAGQSKLVALIEENALKAVAYANTIQNQLTVADTKVAQFNQYKADAKKMKPRIKRLSDANAAHQKYRKSSKASIKEVQIKLNMMYMENAKLKMTGHRKVGNYSFTLFPVKVASKSTDARRVGLVVYNAEGAMKVITRGLDGMIEQPRSHNFKFKEAENEFMHNFFDVAEAHDNNFVDPVLRLLK